MSLHELWGGETEQCTAGIPAVRSTAARDRNT